MPLSATITIKARQAPVVGKSGKMTPWKIESTDGVVFNCFGEAGKGLIEGNTYNIAYEERQNNPAYPANKVIVESNKATGGGNGASGTVTVHAPAQSQSHWDEVDIRRHTVNLTVGLMAAGQDIGQALDYYRAEWIAHIERSKTPTVKKVTTEELMKPDDWDEFK